MPWSQIYTPLGNLLLSALVASLPVVVLLGLLAFWHVRAHLAALAGLASALLVAIVVYGMPVPLALAAAGNGLAYGLFPIGWIVLSAIFMYDLTVMTGKFEVIKQTIAGLASDRRVQALLIGFSFGAFIEGAAGFGTPVAICAAMLIGLGFKPLPAAGLSLIGNTAPVAFGALGTPIIALAGVTGLPLDGPERHGRAATSALFRHCPVLAGVGHGGAQGHVGSVACLPGIGIGVCHPAVRREQLLRAFACRHCLSPFLHLFSRSLSPFLAAPPHLALQP